MALSLLIAACVQLEPRPRDWLPPAGDGGDCDAIAGHYLNQGEAANGERIELAPRLVRPAPTGRTAEEREERQKYLESLRLARAVSIDLPAPDVLRVRALGATAAEWTYDRKNGEWSCDAGALSIRRSGGVQGIGGAGIESNTRTLYRAQEHLLLEHRIGGAGIVLLVPIATYETRWARFPVAPPSSRN